MDGPANPAKFAQVRSGRFDKVSDPPFSVLNAKSRNLPVSRDAILTG